VLAALDLSAAEHFREFHDRPAVLSSTGRRIAMSPRSGKRHPEHYEGAHKLLTLASQPSGPRRTIE
jgi:FMN-dependent NADH-azoreductase